jgi:AraC-like DNA-binding protein
MLTLDGDLRVQVQRDRRGLRVTASACDAQALSVEATFSGGPEGVWFRFVEGGTARVFSREEVAQQRPLAAILRLIADEVELSKSPSDALLGLLFRSLLVYVARASQAVPRPQWGRPLRDRRIERALALLDSDLSKFWTVEQLARAVGLSRPVFAREFVRMLQLSPMRYLTQRRMEVAADLLLESDATLADIAGRVGYQSEFAFGRAFKRHHHVAPGTFRRQPLSARSTALCLAA